MLAGRAPRRAGEIALGARSMAKLHTGLGGHVDARIGTRSARLRVVGRTVLPEFGDAGQLGTGSLMTLHGLDRLLPRAPRNVFLVRFRPGTDVGVERVRMARAIEPVPARFQARPEDLIELSRGGGLLVTLVVLMAILGFVTLLHALVTSVRGRLRSFAVLRVLGFTRAQTRAVVHWQVLTLVAAALAIGLPVGSLAGRATWTAFADQLGVASDPTIPSVGLLLVIAVGALVVALAAALLPAGLAGRARAVGVLPTD
jgi:putative ABC transport system permease protein